MKRKIKISEINQGLKDIVGIDLMHFADQTSQFLEDKTLKRRNFEDLTNFPLVPGKQAIYVMDWQKNQVTYQRNIFELLGYTDEEFDDSTV